MNKQSIPEVHIGSAAVGGSRPPFIIAEMSGNHNQSLDRALEIVAAAAAAGADALKLQTYTADTMTLDVTDGDFLIQDPDSPWYGRTLYELYEKAHTPWEWQEAIFERCRELGIICFSTPFDETAVNLLEELGAPAYKISSFENIDLPLINRVAKTGKPLIISTGLATVAEIDDAVRAARYSGATEIILLKCTSTYPAPPQLTDLRTIPHMAELFNLQVGLSDHTPGIGVALASIAFGATVIEKHLTLDRNDGGVDAAFSLEPSELRALVEEASRAWQSLGEVRYGPRKKEKASVRFRRSLYITSDLKAGDLLTAENVRSIRPGFGMSPKFLNNVLGKRIGGDVRRGTPLTWDLLA